MKIINKTSAILPFHTKEEREETRAILLDSHISFSAV